jgi:CheY-like chemotaxis protein
VSQAGSSQRLLDGLSLLVVEDEAIIAFLLEDMLGELGAADVRYAASVGAALALLDEKLPDLAVLDVNLRGERVYPVAERLDAAGVLFLFTTGYGRSGIEPKWHGKTVLQKPFSIDSIAHALASVLSER